MRLMTIFVLWGVSALQPVPPPPFANGSSGGLTLDNMSKTIYITSNLASHRDSEGLTLIPPSGYDFASILQDELSSITQWDWSLEVVDAVSEGNSGIFLDLIAANASANFTYENGIPTEEGYTLYVDEETAYIGGSGSRGMWWGTRTLLQQLMLSNGTSVPAITIMDAPAYATRGYMLDAGRKWYSLAFLKEMCTYASFFKMSEFHYHTSDNFPLNRGHNDTWNEVYAQFSLRPESADLEGIIQRSNETLSRKDFEDLQQHCAQRGVTVVPEIEAPGHCLTITKWKPELALDKKDLLNLTHPDSIPTVKRIWQEFLPWFQTKEIHIGADEYDATLADDYISFVNDMAVFVNETSGKRIRIWGTHEPSENLTISKEVIIQHWQYGQSDPIELQSDEYEMVNSQDWWAYMSLKNDHVPISPSPYAQFFNESRVMNFADRVGWQWQPAFFNQLNTTEQLPNEASENKGAVMAAWNDNGPDATTQLEAYYAMRRGIPLVAARAWSGARGAALDADTIDQTLDFLSAKVPGQNLDRKTDFISWNRGTEADPVALGHGSKGMNYTLIISATGPFTLSSVDVTLSLSDNGTLGFNSDGWEYPLRSVSETDGFDPRHPGRIWVNATSSSHEVVKVPTPVDIKITGDVIGGSRVFLNGSFAGRFEVFVFGGRNTQFSWSQMAFVAPLETLSGGIGKILLSDKVEESGGTKRPPVQSFGESAYQRMMGLGVWVAMMATVSCLVFF
ncbi:beta-N-hexosaminidase [Pseudomassariella vexata]|uniref:beta-N-acetylhexosaminidase n=1 Tax=Pseudomassariella vexata TaxID=1141098 RepID=A0A1Y2DSU0_9PEZI|nr:beta-N-hexosaminidase [Pseudomassariella vexata]ORY62343.1 beta-N-hexosaminidase [Pseudomassariella vexata]